MLGDLKLPVRDHEFVELALTFLATVLCDDDDAVVAKTLALLDAHCLQALGAARKAAETEVPSVSVLA